MPAEPNTHSVKPDAHRLLPRHRNPIGDAVTLAPPAEVSDLQAEIARLTKIVRTQGKENRRLNSAFAKLKDEKRSTHDMIQLAEQLQAALEDAEEVAEKYEAGSLYQAVENLKGSSKAMSVRYGRLHRALRALLADSSQREDAEQALRDVEDKRWVRAEIARLYSEDGA